MILCLFLILFHSLFYAKASPLDAHLRISFRLFNLFILIIKKLFNKKSYRSKAARFIINLFFTYLLSDKKTSIQFSINTRALKVFLFQHQIIKNSELYV